MNGVKSKVIEDLEGAGVPGGLAPIKKGPSAPERKSHNVSGLVQRPQSGLPDRHRVDKPEIVSITL